MGSRLLGRPLDLCHGRPTHFLPRALQPQFFSKRVRAAVETLGLIETIKLFLFRFFALPLSEFHDVFLEYFNSPQIGENLIHMARPVLRFLGQQS